MDKSCFVISNSKEQTYNALSSDSAQSIVRPNKGLAKASLFECSQLHLGDSSGYLDHQFLATIAPYWNVP